MLVLSRKPRESIVIGGAGSMGREFTVTVLEIRGGKVKLGFDADPSVSVQRSEVWARVRTGEMPDGHTEGFGALSAK
jgi:carbon storage regulator CsrA